MPVARSSDDPTFDMSGNTITALASPTRGAAETIMYRIDLRAGGALPPHRHDHEEVFHLVSGSMTSVLEGVEHAVEPGDTVIIPAGTLHHGFTGDEDARMLVAMPVGTLFIREGEEGSVPPWGT